MMCRHKICKIHANTNKVFFMLQPFTGSSESWNCLLLKTDKMPQCHNLMMQTMSATHFSSVSIHTFLSPKNGTINCVITAEPKEMMGFGDDSGISWTICKQSAPCTRQPHQHLITQFFTGRMLFLTPNQQCQALKAQRTVIQINNNMNIGTDWFIYNNSWREACWRVLMLLSAFEGKGDWMDCGSNTVINCWNMQCKWNNQHTRERPERRFSW